MYASRTPYSWRRKSCFGKPEQPLLPPKFISFLIPPQPLVGLVDYPDDEEEEEEESETTSPAKRARLNAS